MVKSPFTLLLLSIFVAVRLSATIDDTSQRSFDERIRSLQVKSINDNLTVGTPCIIMDTGDAIKIDFDILSEDRDYLRYEVIHCNADWKPSTLSYLEYLDGFNEGQIELFDFSMATTVDYVHYSLVLPNEDFSFKLSGNYIVRIYDESEPDNTLVLARFTVSEQTAPVSAFITSRTDSGYNSKYQQLEIAIDCDRAPVRDLFNDLKVVITQNGRPDAIHVTNHPMRVTGRKVIYEHSPELIFDAGNEYRRFETVLNTLPGMNTDFIEWHAPYYHHYLAVDKPRSAISYSYDQTLRGGYVVREYNSDNGDIDADYVVVHFSLEMPELFNTDIFIDSDAFDRVLGPESRMVYNRGTGRYEKAALLKQGSYSYQYLAVPSGKLNGLTQTVEGDKYQTVNQYTVDVYTRVPGERYDRMIGHAIFFVNQ
ncbi:MAG: DUF5103 domain-containing protein [Muribaculaceae bacterium]|nr:DUF5103 domain-containing protein [Muribaculaceae bacterium]